MSKRWYDMICLAEIMNDNRIYRFWFDLRSPLLYYKIVYCLMWLMIPIVVQEYTYVFIIILLLPLLETHQKHGLSATTRRLIKQDYKQHHISIWLSVCVSIYLNRYRNHQKQLGLIRFGLSSLPNPFLCNTVYLHQPLLFFTFYIHMSNSIDSIKPNL